MSANSTPATAADILESAVATALSRGEIPDVLAKATELSLKMHAEDLVAEIDPVHDRAGLFVPLDIDIDGKWRDGCALTLEDRAIFCWHTGILRIKTYTRIVHFGGVVEVNETEVEPKIGWTPERVTLSVEGESPMRFRGFNPEGTWNLPRLLQGVLQGSVTFADDAVKIADDFESG